MQEAHWRQLAGMDRDETARRSGCTYGRGEDAFTVSLLNERYRVDMGAGAAWKLIDGQEPTPAGYLEQLCILTYLIYARDIPLAAELVGVEKLDPGGFFFRGSHRLPVEKLHAVFGRAPKKLLAAERILGARACTYGDASVEIPALRRIPITVVVWGEDEEFPARASILFDKSASNQMPLDGLYGLAKLTIDRAVKVADMEG